MTMVAGVEKYAVPPNYDIREPDVYTDPHERSVEGYAELASIVRAYDEDWVNHYNFFMDAMLVFATLFSAILAAFNIQLYTTLEEDPQDVTVRLLSQISSQLAMVSSGANFTTDVTQATLPNTSPFQALPVNINVNILWFAALLCSLAASCEAMAIKAWLRSYVMQGTSISSDHTLRRMRDFFRSRPFRWFMIFQGVILVFLILVSLSLFAGGLSKLLMSLDAIVGRIVTVMIIALYAIFLSFSLPPWVLWVFAYSRLYRHYSCWDLAKASGNSLLRIVNLCKIGDLSASLDVPALLDVDRELGDDDLLGHTLRNCIAEADGEYVVQFVRGVLENRLCRPLYTLADSLLYIRDIRTECLIALMHILADALQNEVNSRSRLEIQGREGVFRLRWVKEAARWVSDVMVYLEATHRSSAEKILLRSVDVFGFLCRNDPDSLQDLEILSVLIQGYPFSVHSDAVGDVEDPTEVGLKVIQAATAVLTKQLAVCAAPNPIRLCREILTTLHLLSRMRKCNIEMWVVSFNALQSKLLPALEAHISCCRSTIPVQPMRGSSVVKGKSYMEDIGALCEELDNKRRGFVHLNLLGAIRDSDPGKSLTSNSCSSHILHQSNTSLEHLRNGPTLLQRHFPRPRLDFISQIPFTPIPMPFPRSCLEMVHQRPRTAVAFHPAMERDSLNMHSISFHTDE